MGHAYLEVVRDRRRLRMQMQAYAACDDPEVRATVQKGFGPLINEIQEASHADHRTLASFIAKGMLLNVMASMDALESTGHGPSRAAWACASGRPTTSASADH